MNPRIKLKLARVEHGLTQAELAEKVGVTRQTIGLIENGGKWGEHFVSFMQGNTVQHLYEEHGLTRLC